jgi:Ca2+-binding EF-hand superfamily protein
LAVFVVTAFTAQAGAPASSAKPDAATRWMKTLDKDSDGMVSLAEAKDYVGHRFDQLDGDHDGTLTLKELKGTEAQLKALDKDHDGTLTQDELLAGVEAAFTKADADKEGTLSLDELKAPAGADLIALLEL